MRTITTIICLLILTTCLIASDRKARGRAAWAWVVSQQPKKIVLPETIKKGCPCSTECVCGCNSGKPCDCNKVKAATVIESATCTTGT